MHKIMDIDRGFASSSGIRNGNMSNKELVEELQKQIIKEFKKRKVYSSDIDGI